MAIPRYGAMSCLDLSAADVGALLEMAGAREGALALCGRKTRAAVNLSETSGVLDEHSEQRLRGTEVELSPPVALRLLDGKHAERLHATRDLSGRRRALQLRRLRESVGCACARHDEGECEQKAGSHCGFPDVFSARICRATSLSGSNLVWRAVRAETYSVGTTKLTNISWRSASMILVSSSSGRPAVTAARTGCRRRPIERASARCLSGDRDGEGSPRSCALGGL